MIKIAAARLVAAMLCSGSILTKEDLDCWYEDSCMTANGAAPTVRPGPYQNAQLPVPGR